MSRWEGVHDVSLQAKPLAIATLKKTETRTNIPTITAADRIGFAENGSKKKDIPEYCTEFAPGGECTGNCQSVNRESANHCGVKIDSGQISQRDGI